jgi:hypothetical protein
MPIMDLFFNSSPEVYHYLTLYANYWGILGDYADYADYIEQPNRQFRSEIQPLFRSRLTPFLFTGHVQNWRVNSLPGDQRCWRRGHPDYLLAPCNTKSSNLRPRSQQHAAARSEQPQVKISRESAVSPPSEHLYPFVYRLPSKWENQGQSTSTPGQAPRPDRVSNNTLSRQELVAWLNNLLQLNITKVEQCGTG